MTQVIWNKDHSYGVTKEFEDFEDAKELAEWYNMIFASQGYSYTLASPLP